MGTYTHLKRLLDILFSITLLIVLSPVLIIIMLIIKSTSKGPVIFKQRRLGTKSTEFEILKFRSMKPDAPNLSSREIDNDAYVTTIGKILRRTSLDELPQLINILKGDMSFVGPRPFIPNEGEINELRKANSIDALRPGLTGWAQVVARDTCDQREKLKLDLFYKENISLKLDMKIIVYTFFSMSGK